ncbi:hypothetical protein [Tenacibaculum salmonis]|uniref:hypothetical protein n=1 Tax=Tenacibaculum sp. P3-BQ1 TaxID=3232310 RepID=UPI0034E03266
MEIQKLQIKKIQTILSKKKLDRDDRLDFISTHLERQVDSIKELTVIEADDLIYFLNTGKKSTANWAFFDKSKFTSERKLLWSYLYQAQWTVQNERHGEVPDIERLSNFLKSPKSPVNKPLKQWEKEEWEKILHVFKNIIKLTYK